MTRLRLTGAGVILLLALSAVTSGAASAKTQVLTLESFGVLAPGTTIQTYTEDVSISTPIGEVTCSGVEALEGKLLSNQEKTDKIALELALPGSLTGSEPCPSTTGLGEAYVTLAAAVPITLSVSANTKAELRSATSKLAIELAFPSGPHCIYEAAKWKGAIITEEMSGPLVYGFTKQKHKLVKATSSPICPKSATVSAYFSYSRARGFTIFDHVGA